MFGLFRTFDKPSDSQTGFPAPGAGAQTTGPASQDQAQAAIPAVWEARRPTKGRRTWLNPSAPSGAQRGFPAPLAAEQTRPPGSMPNVPQPFGTVYQHWTPYYDRGAAAYVPNFGRVLVNPIGAGIVALHMPQASYGLAAQYDNGALWWTSQDIPTSIHMQGLVDPEELQAIVGDLAVQGMVRTTG